jgi:hypothetical protein
MTIKKPNGKAHDVDCGTDHADDKAVEELFATVERYHGLLGKASGGGRLMTVGLRSHYVASFHAAPLMIDNGRG